MKVISVLNYLFLLLLISCTKDSNPTMSIPSSPAWNNFTITQVNYDSLYIESKDSIILNKKSVLKIRLSSIEDNIEVIVDSLNPVYHESGDNFYPNFIFKEKIDESLIYYFFKLEYFLTDSSVIEVDSSAFMLNYPYHSVRLFKRADEISGNQTDFQDFYLTQDILFYHPLGSLGLFKYDLTSDVSTELFGYSSGDYIAYDSIYVFWDFGRQWLYRYNLALDTTDLEIDLSGLNYSRIAGLECHNGDLYVLFHSLSGNYLAKFSYDGQLLSSIPYSGETYFLTIDDDYFLSHDYHTNLYLYDLNSGNLLDTKLMPTAEPEGIRIYNSNLYFVDYMKRVIAYLPLSDLY